MNKRICVDIYGERYCLIGDTEEEYAGELAEYVDFKMKEASIQSHCTDARKIAVLTAINIAHELFQLKKDRERMEKEIEGRTTHLIERLDSRISLIRT